VYFYPSVTAITLRFNICIKYLKILGIPLRARFSATIQTCPGTNPVSCTMVTWSLPQS